MDLFADLRDTVPYIMGFSAFILSFVYPVRITPRYEYVNYRPSSVAITCKQYEETIACV